jgi:hypothetical protein
MKSKPTNANSRLNHDTIANTPPTNTSFNQVEISNNPTSKRKLLRLRESPQKKQKGTLQPAIATKVESANSETAIKDTSQTKTSLRISKSTSPPVAPSAKPNKVQQPHRVSTVLPPASKQSQPPKKKSVEVVPATRNSGASETSTKPKNARVNKAPPVKLYTESVAAAAQEVHNFISEVVFGPDHDTSDSNSTISEDERPVLKPKQNPAAISSTKAFPSKPTAPTTSSTRGVNKPPPQPKLSSERTLTESLQTPSLLRTNQQETSVAAGSKIKGPSDNDDDSHVWELLFPELARR